MTEVQAELLGQIERQIIFTPSRTGNRHLRLVYLRGEPGAVGKVHVHPGEEALFTLQGQITMQIGDEEITIGPNEAVMVPPDTEHPFRVTSEEPWLAIASFCDECPVLATSRAGKQS
jgi:quercetin dioxygenase-like cupin family protein